MPKIITFMPDANHQLIKNPKQQYFGSTLCLSIFIHCSSFYATMYSLMAFAASAVTIYTAYVGILFFKYDIPTLSMH